MIDLDSIEFRNGGVSAVLDSRGYWWRDRHIIVGADWEGPFETYRQMIDDAESVFGMCLESVQE